MVKVFPVQAKEKVQDGIQNAAGVTGREHGAGFDGTDNQPKDRCDPRLQKNSPIGIQKRGLLDAIVGGLAGDHDVVDVTLTKPGATDADEAGFLQEVSDGGAAAVTHA